MREDPMKLANALVDDIRNSSTHDYIMRWKGSKIPRGAIIDGIAIVWTQHGIIIGENGEALGYYDRMREFGGDNHDEHAMLITTPEAARVVAPDGTVCSDSP